jgi:molybdenum cofactor guanylyltransferase
VKVLGAIVAGGQARRFGSDKGAALVAGKALIDHVAGALSAVADTVVIVGRTWPNLASIPDQPAPAQGPLGGIAGALTYAEAHGFDAVLSAGCDALGLSADHLDALKPGPAVLASQPVIGLWPTGLAVPLAEWMVDPAHRSVFAFADYCGARRVMVANPPANINWPADLP